jgi:hypothetical protein
MDARSDSGRLASLQPDDTAAKAKRRRQHKAVKIRPFTREQLDQRTAAFKMFESLYAAIAADIGGVDQVSAVQRELIEAFCGVAIRLNDLNTRGLAGQPVDLADLSLAASTLTRLASRIGIHRVPRDVTLDPIAYARSFDEAAE